LDFHRGLGRLSVWNHLQRTLNLRDSVDIFPGNKQLLGGLDRHVRADMQKAQQHNRTGNSGKPDVPRGSNSGAILRAENSLYAIQQ